MRRERKPTPQSLNQESIYQLLAKEEWPELLSFVWHNPSLIASDAILKHAVNTCEVVFFSKLESESDKEKLVSTLESFYILHTQNKYRLSNERFRVVVVELARIWQDKNLERACAYARSYENDEFCNTVIRKYENSLPKKVVHSQSESIHVTENKNITNKDGRRTLFRSKQEKEFFDAVVETFPMFIVYPNVALSSIVDIDLIQEQLTSVEREYYFKGTVDCVVFDYRRELFLPKYFFELDSAYHDDPKRKLNDEKKDKILAAAGQKLFRIRRVNNNQNRGDFLRLIREMMEKEQS